MGIEEDVSRHLEARANRIDPEAGSPIRLEQRSTRRGWVAAAIAAAVVLIVGVVGVLVGTRSDGDMEDVTAAASGTETPTTTALATTTGSEAIPDAPVRADGSPLDFSQVDVSLPVDWVEGVVTHAGVIYGLGGVFSEEPTENRTELWSTVDGVEWSELSTITEGTTHVATLTVGPAGFLAVGTRWEDLEPTAERTFYSPPASSEPLAWTSTDGRNWTEHPLPTGRFDDSVVPTSVHSGWAAIGTAGAVVLGTAEPNIEALVFASLPDDVLAVLERSGSYGFGMGGSPFEFTVHGPGGTTLWQGGAEELGWDAETTAAVESMFSGAGGSRSILWHSEDLMSWIELQSPPFGSDTYIHQLASLADGAMMAVGGGETGPAAWISADGFSWERIDAGLDISSVHVWVGRTLGLAFLGNETAVVEWAGDGWVAISPEDPFGGPETWHIQRLSAGDGGIAAVAMGYDESEMRGPAPVTVTGNNGRTVTMDEVEGFVSVREGDEVLLEIPLWEESADNPVVDVEAGTLTYIDPETGAALVTVGITALEDAQQALYQEMNERTAVLTSPDGETWSVTYLEDQFDRPGFVQQIVVAGSRVVLLRQPVDDNVASETEVYDPPPLEVWVADL